MTDRIAAQERIAQLDVLRGIAILFILFMNIPYLAGYALYQPVDPRLLGWTGLDQAAYVATWMIEGSMRGILELLFGAGMMIMARHAMQPDGPVRVADVWTRRNMWLIAFGLFNVLVLMWPGDILLPYGIAAMFIFPFRLLKPVWKVVIGGVLLLGMATQGIGTYAERSELVAQADAAAAKRAAGQQLSKADAEAVTEWRRLEDRWVLPPRGERAETNAREAEARRGSFENFWSFQANDVYFGQFWGQGWIGFIVLEAFATMLIGAALYEWGVIQGRRSTRFYLGLLAVGYGIGLTIRALAVDVKMDFSSRPDVVFIVFQNFTRELVVLSHIAAVSLLLRSGAGRALLRPFEAAGKLPLSIYFSAALACALIFPGFSGGQWGLHGAGGQFAIACLIIAVQVVAGNLWLRAFETGPPEWLWKTLAYGRRQSFRRAAPADTNGSPVAAE